MTVWRWESGRQMPSPKHLKRVAELLGVEPTDLIRETK